MEELSAREVEGLLTFNKKPIALFLYTPLCGTCKLAAEMVGVVEKMLPDVDVYALNINLMPTIAWKWEITSIPCIAILHKQHLTRRMYAMNSVPDIYQYLRPLQENMIE